MKYAFDLAARENQTADVDATITSNKLNTGTDKRSSYKAPLTR